MNTKFYLMWKDIPVIYFNTAESEASILNSTHKPFSICGSGNIYSSLHKYLSDRIILFNRIYCKEILDVCGLDAQDPLSICLVSRALSFTDFYWIKGKDETISFSDVNLRHNVFNNVIEYTALTGRVKQIVVSDKLFTGQLTTKGTRPKCFSREENRIYMYKAETSTEIDSEILSYLIARLLNIRASQYQYARKYDRECSKCEISNPEVELVSAREILSHFGETSFGLESNTMKCFLQFEETFKMFIFDYLTLNTDRNRDNFGLASKDSRVIGLYPLFDHDSCFKGLSENAIYFPINKPLSKIPDILVRYNKMDIVRDSVLNAAPSFKSDKFREIFLRFQSALNYDNMMERMDKLIQVAGLDKTSLFD